jgi:hypothetical protein
VRFNRAEGICSLSFSADVAIAAASRLDEHAVERSQHKTMAPRGKYIRGGSSGRAPNSPLPPCETESSDMGVGFMPDD